MSVVDFFLQVSVENTLGYFDLNPETNSEDLIMDLGRGETDEDEITVHSGANEFHSKANASISSVQWKLGNDPNISIIAWTVA